MAFRVRDKIVHPEFGPGMILAISQKQFGSLISEEYVLRFPGRRQRVTTPVGKAAEVGLRPISTPVAFEVLWAILRGDPNPLSDDAGERERIVTERIASGSPFRLAQAIRDLVGREPETELDHRDRRLLEEAEVLLADELAYAQEIELDEALGIVRTKSKVATAVS